MRWLERRAGELLQEAAEKGERQTPGGDRKSKLHDATLIPTVSDLGTDRYDSHRFQLLATIPEAKYEEVLKRTSSRAAFLCE